MLLASDSQAGERGQGSPRACQPLTPDTMLKDRRKVVFVAVGWLILSAQHPNPSAKPEQTNAQSRIAESLSNIATTYHQQTERAERAPETQPCKAGDDHRDSDLCAQWKAADAAEKSARWAAFAGWFGGLSFLGVLAAVGLAFHSNWIARDTAKRQLRAYAQVSEVKIKFEPPLPVGYVPAKGQERRIHFKFLISNTGATPAIDLKVRTFIEYRKRGDGAGGHDVEYNDLGSSIEFDDSMPIYYTWFDEVTSRSLSVFLAVGIVYRDIFGAFHATDLNFRYDPEVRIDFGRVPGDGVARR